MKHLLSILLVLLFAGSAWSQLSLPSRAVLSIEEADEAEFAELLTYQENCPGGL